MACCRSALLLISALCCTSLADEGKGKPHQSDDDSTVFMQTTMHLSKLAANKLQVNKDVSIVAENASKKANDTHLQKSTENGNNANHSASAQDKVAHLQKSAEERNSDAYNASANGFPGIIGSVTKGVKDVADTVSKVLSVGDLKGLIASYEDIQTDVNGFGANVTSCATALKSSPAFKTTDIVAIKATITEGFECLNSAYLLITGDVKDSASKTVSILQNLLPDNLENIVNKSETAVIKAADAVEVQLTDAIARVESLDNSTICDLVPDALGGLEDSSASFLSAMTSFDVNAVVDKVEGGKETLDTLIGALPSPIKGKVNDALSTVHATADDIVSKVPAPVTDFKDAISSGLSDGFCKVQGSAKVALKAGASHLPIFLPVVFLVSMFLTGSSM